MYIHNVAIIRSGISGMAAAKEFVACGILPTVFEKQLSLGGVWNPTTGKMWDSLKTNISYYSCMFSDYPWKNPSGSFPGHREVYDYLCGYAEHFDLVKYIKFNSTVQKVKQSAAKWHVEWQENEKTHSALFDSVMVCSGIMSRANPYPNYGVNTIHSEDYRSPEPYRGKTVTNIGNGPSGCEIAADIAMVAERVIHVTHKNVWVLPREVYNRPADRVFYNREEAAKSKKLTIVESNQAVHTFLRSGCPQEKVCPELKVDTPITELPIISISNGYVEGVQAKKIVIAKEVPKNTDAIIVCNGYETRFSFLEQDILDIIDYQPKNQVSFLLHKTMLHPKLPHLAFIGCYKHPLFGLIELIARAAAMYFSNKVPYPTQDEMAAGIAAEQKIRDLCLQFPHGDYVAFSDGLAADIGVLPDFEKIREENPPLYNLLWKAPHLTPSYRIKGPGSDAEAAIKLIEELSKDFIN